MAHKAVQAFFIRVVMQINKKLIATLGAVAASIVVSTIPELEGRELVPYKDIGGVSTYCAGITNPPPIKGHTYTKEECVVIESAVEAKHAEEFMACAPSNMTDGQKVAGVVFAYNVGTSAACSSSFVRLLKQGKPKEACEALLKWKYVTVKGKLIDCSIRNNNCYGVYARRLTERNFCLN